MQTQQVTEAVVRANRSEITVDSAPRAETRADAVEFLELAPRAGVRAETTTYPLARANEALDDLRHGRFQGAAVLLP